MALGLQLSIFDSRRGQQEGQELDKILFFYPLDCPLTTQMSIVGLSEGLVTFTKMFSPAAPCEFMDTEKHVHVFYECEADVWMVMIVEKANEAEQLTRYSAYRNLLKDLYGLFRAFYGTMTAMLRDNPVGDAVRSCLYGLVPDYLGDIASGKSVRLPTISDSLAEHGTVQTLSLDPSVLLEAQSLVSLLESWSATCTVHHSLILFHKYLISSTLPPDDTAALFSYAVLRLAPAAISQSYAQGPKRSYTRHSVLNTVVSTFMSDHKPAPLAEPPSAERSDSDSSSKIHCRPLVQDAWWQDSDGFLVTNAWGMDSGNAVVPTVCLHSEDVLQLCVYQHRALTLLMLLPSTSGYEALTQLRGQVLEQAADPIRTLEEKFTKHWGGANSLHVPGYRYLLHDSSRKTVKASPPSKVATLGKDSLIALDRVRSQIDMEKSRLRPGGGVGVCGGERDSDMCLRARNNAWVSARSRAGHELFLVLEKASDTLVLVSDAVEKFDRRYCGGRFSSD